VRRSARSTGGSLGSPSAAGRDIIGIGLPFLLRSVSVLNDLTTADFTEATDPFALFQLWLKEAAGREVNDPDAMTLATVDATGLPDARMILCKGADARGLVFYTNIESAKGRELRGQPRAAALFHWKSLRRQARFRGAISEVTAAESDAYFASRPRGSQIGAWASAQSRPLASRADLEASIQAYERKFASTEVPRPEYWRGYRLTPVEIEFWRDRPSRLHDRIMFTRSTPESAWGRRLLYP
jgi:pyridoxamine 5'-phosphate oxidase